MAGERFSQLDSWIAILEGVEYAEITLTDPQEVADLVDLLDIKNVPDYRTTRGEYPNFFERKTWIPKKYKFVIAVFDDTEFFNDRAQGKMRLIKCKDQEELEKKLAAIWDEDKIIPEWRKSSG